MKTTRRPIALISMRVTEETSYVEPRSALAHDYVRWFEGGDGGSDAPARTGASVPAGPATPDHRWTVIPVPASTAAAAPYLDLPGVGLVVLTGGNNVDPALYGGIEEVSQVYPERDRTEYALIAGALERGIPVWGVCRGLHTINVYFGGSLTPRVEGHVARDHTLTSDNPLLADVVCNSYHNQGVRGDDLSGKLRVLAHSADGLVEALYHPTEPVAAVQWHPERQNQPYDRELLATFLAGGLQA
jgi:gamma-glutamyl-gamma-aminobutyrate hydrolase PuuD